MDAVHTNKISVLKKTNYTPQVPFIHGVSASTDAPDMVTEDSLMPTEPHHKQNIHQKTSNTSSYAHRFFSR